MLQENIYAVSIADATKIIGLGRTSLYAAIASGKLKARKAGRRTLIELDALHRFVDGLPTVGDNSN